MDDRTNLVPARFAGRMTEDVWFFGLLIRDGTVVSIQAIEFIHQAGGGSTWLDVRMGTGNGSNDLKGH